jgi:peptide/nickel transport system substrate-binding protein
VRVRRGLLHAIDRAALAAALLDGETPVSDSPISPWDPKWDWVQDTVTRYPYDVRRAQEQLALAGWRRGGDGTLASDTGDRLILPLWTVAGADTEKVIAVVGDYWKDAGIQVEQYVTPRARARDLQHRASFPAFHYAGTGVATLQVLARVYGRTCPTEESRWVGSNLGCYRNPENDRIIDGINTALEAGDQRRLWREFARHQSDELPVLPMYFNLAITLFRDGVTGVKGDTHPSTSATWNVAEWDLRSPTGGIPVRGQVIDRGS